jgi:AcrR family transcriptional regulator
VNIVHFVNVLHESLSPRRLRTRAKRSARILDAAMRIVTDDGFDALTMGHLANELDSSAGSLYRYFASKDALVVALQAQAIARIHEMLIEERTAWQASLPKDHASAALSEVFGAANFYRNLAQREPRIFRLVSSMLADPRKLVDDEEARAAAAPFGALLSEASALFAAAAEQRALSDGNALERTLVFWTALHGVMMVDKLDRLTPPSGEHAGVFRSATLTISLTATLLRGWGAQDKHVERAICWLDALKQSNRGKS